MIVVICKKVTQPLTPGFLAGDFCSVCKEQLQASPTGRVAIEGGGTVFCNAHGFALAHLKQSANELAGTILTPELIQQLERWAREEAARS